MKKIKILSISIIFILSVLLALYMNKPIPIAMTKSAATSNADLTFAVIGDVHENIDNFQIAINDLSTINSQMDALVLNGDTVDQGLDKQYDSVKATLSKNKDLLPKTIIKNIGNHEFFDYNISTNSKEQVQTFINKYLEFSGEEKVYHDKWVKNYHFISLGSEDGNSETEDSITAFISEQQQKWLKEKLAENYQKGKPIFVFLHQNLNRLTTGDASRIGVEQNEQIEEILSQYPEVILFASHSHIDLTESSVMTEQQFTIVNTGAIHYSFVPDETNEKGRKIVQYIKGVYIEVNDNKVVVKGRDMKEAQWIFTKEVSK